MGQRNKILVIVWNISWKRGVECGVCVYKMWPAPTKAALSRWGRYELQANKWGTITMSSTRLPYFNWPEHFYFSRYRLDSNNKISCILSTLLPCQYLKSDKIDLRSLSWEQVTNVYKNANQNTQEVKNVRFLISTRHNNLRIFCILCCL